MYQIIINRPDRSIGQNYDEKESFERNVVSFQYQAITKKMPFLTVKSPFGLLSGH